jgi:DtxR family Mn-dependent transcriptional regulator
MLSYTEENYLKTLLKLAVEKGEAGTNELATMLGVKPATATDMLKKLREKKLIDYEKYGKITLTDEGKQCAVSVVRRHRLWETFLYEKLAFSWDEIHELAEQLEHIQSEKLVERLDKFLNYPVFDPHGDAIPNAQGEMREPIRKTLNDEIVGHRCKMVAVKDNSSAFLQYVDKTGLALHKTITVLSKHAYDELLEIDIEGQKVTVSHKFACNILVACEACEK